MLSELRARAWQIGTVAAGAAALALAVTAGALAFQKAGLERDVAQLQVRVQKIGADLTTCRANTTTLQAGITAQNARIAQLAADGAARLQETERQVEAARRATAAANDRVNRFLSQAPAGATTCERVDDIDRRIMEMLK